MTKVLDGFGSVDSDPDPDPVVSNATAALDRMYNAAFNLNCGAAVPLESIRREVVIMAVNSGDLGFCPYVGHSGAVTLTWEGDSVTKVECAFGDHKTCGYSDRCELYQRHPVGYVQTFPNDQREHKN